MTAEMGRKGRRQQKEVSGIKYNPDVPPLRRDEKIAIHSKILGSAI